MIFQNRLTVVPAIKNYILFIGFVIAVFVFTFFSLQTIEIKTRESAGESLLSALNSSHTALNMWIKHRRDDMSRLISDKMVVSAASELVLLDHTGEELVHHPVQKQLRDHLSYSIQHTGDLGYFLISRNGISIASMRDENIGTKNLISMTTPHLIEQVFEGRYTLIPPLESDVPLPNLTKDLEAKYPTMFLAAPVRNDSDSIIAIFTIRMNPFESFSEITRLAQIGQTGESYAIDKNAWLISHSRFKDQLQEIGLLKNSQNDILNIRILDPGGNLLKGYESEILRNKLPLTYMAGEVIKGNACLNTKGYRDYRGIKVMGAGLWDESLGIGIITEINIDESMHPYYYARNIIFGLSLLILIASFFVFYLNIRYRKKDNEKNFRYQQELKSELEKRTKSLKSTNRKLAEQERSLKLALEGANAGMFSFHLQSKIMMWDERSIELHGLAREEFGNDLNSAFKYVVESDIQRINTALDDIKNNNNDNLEIDYEVVKGKDKIRHIQTLGKIERDIQGIALYIHGTHTDITRKKMDERAISESELRFRSLHDVMKQGVMIVNHEGVIRSLNPAGEKILGLTSGKIEGKDFSKISWNIKNEKGEEYPLEELPLNRAFIEGIEVRNVLMKYVHPLGKKNRWLSVTAIPLYINTDSKPHEVYTIFEDITQQRVILQELRKSEEKYRYLVDNSLIGVFQMNREGEILYANQAFSDILEYISPLELMGTDYLLKYKNPDCGDLLINRLDEQGQVNNFEFELVSKKGTIKSVIMNARLSNDNISGMLQDISKRKEYERSIKRSESNLKRIIEFSPQAMAVTDQNNNIVQLNKKFTDLFGYTKEEIRNFSDWWPKAYPDKIYREKTKNIWLSRIEHSRETGSEFEAMEAKVTCKDGRELWIEFRYGSFDNSRRNLTLFTDLTERKRIEEALRSALVLNQSMYNYSVPEIIDMALEEGVRLTQSQIGFFHFVDTDQHTISLQTWSKETLTNCSVPDKEEHYPIDQAGIWVECIAARKPVIHNDYIKIKNKKGLPEGHFPLIRELVVPIFEGERIVAIIGVGNKSQYYTRFDVDQLSLMADNIWNIVRKKRMEEDVIKAKEEAEKANMAKSVFLANMSHEIRTPMNAVLGFADILDDQLTDPIKRNYLKSIKSSGKTLLGLIDDILDLSKIEAGKMEIIHDPVDLGVLLQEINQIFTLKIEQQDISFIIDERHCEGYVFMIDELRLRQILLNIVGNAVKFTESGHIQITTHTKNIIVENHTCDLVIEVEDTGIGIPEEYLDVIFDSFRQQDEQNRRRYGGTGLGLTITKRLVDIMNGSIEVKSEVGKGSMFRIKFKGVKYRVKTILEEEQPFDLSTIKFKKSRLLIVDDVESNRELIKGFFRHTKVEVDVAENGQQALIHIQKKTPDIILMDIRMPEMNGYEATQRIKEMDKYKDIPVIAITASVMDSDKEKMKAFKFEDFLRKPVHMRDLYMVLSKFLPHTTQKSGEHEKVITKIIDTGSNVTRELKELMYGKLMKLWQSVKSADNMEEITSFGQEIETAGQKYTQEALEEFGKELINYSGVYDIDNTRILLSSYKDLIDKLSGSNG